MRLIYSQGFSKNEKLEWKPVVFSNVIHSFKTIQDAMTELSIEFEDPANEVRQATRKHSILSLKSDAARPAFMSHNTLYWLCSVLQ